jgi:hypothetical protein
MTQPMELCYWICWILYRQGHSDWRYWILYRLSATVTGDTGYYTDSAPQWLEILDIIHIIIFIVAGNCFNSCGCRDVGLINESRLGGVMVSVLATGPKGRGFKPGRGR